MYKPKERIRHTLPVMGVPTADEAAKLRLFSPLQLASGLTLADRTWVPAMVPWRATEEGFVTDDVVDWYARFAAGEPGAIVIEATGVRDVPSGPLLRIGHDRFVPGLARVVEAVRRASGGRTRLFVQLIDFLRIRRRPERSRYFAQFLRLRRAHRERLAEHTDDATWLTAEESDVRAALAARGDDELRALLDEREHESLTMGDRERVTDVHLPHVRELPEVLPELFAAAAARARDAGFDGVELHYAHAYTMASFLSRRNTRDDGYGGSIEGRLRLPLEVLAHVRARVGAAYAVGARILCDEAIEGGSDVGDAERIGAALAKGGLDFLSLSTGGKFEDAKPPKVGEAAYPYTGPSGFECMPTAIADARGPFGRNLAKQARVRAAIRAAGLATPVVVAGGIGDLATAEGALTRGDGDLVGAARQTLADPDWWKKLRTGHADAIRRCLYSNYCEALDQRHKQVTCQLWDREALDEPDVRRSHDGKRRLTAPRG